MNEITFDKTLGISEDEQKEIFDGLDTLTKNNLASTISIEKDTAKRGFLFPLLVNVIAAVILAAGLIVMGTLHAQKQEVFTTGDAMLNGAERQLIEEIRKETAEQLNAKDVEIADIMEKLASIDVEIENLRKEDITEAIEAKIRALTQQKEEYQAWLTQLQEEKGRILEAARLKENSLKSKNDEMAHLYAQLRGDLTTAQEQLQKITSEDEKARLVENQFRGYYVILNEQVNSGLWGAAAETISAMRDLLETPLLQENRSFQAQKDSRRASLDALSALVTANLSSGITVQPAPLVSDTSVEKDSENQKKIADLEEKIAAQEQILNSYKNQEQSLNAYQQTISDLRTQNTGLQQTITANSTTINDLQTQNESLQQRAAQLQQQNDAIRQLLNNN
ncbi:MAG: hypothetical protein LBH75_06370 [Treponema sp.]|jgi:DNA repair exonuclease SbcCD ATPase subunit|nr:hypothetical protein [Treponema sp.]